MPPSSSHNISQQYWLCTPPNQCSTISKGLMPTMCYCDCGRIESRIIVIEFSGDETYYYYYYVNGEKRFREKICPLQYVIIYQTRKPYNFVYNIEYKTRTIVFTSHVDHMWLGIMYCAIYLITQNISRCFENNKIQASTTLKNIRGA